MRRTQLTISQARPLPLLMAPIFNGGADHRAVNKPMGGLWTSTRTGAARSEWVDWCERCAPEYVNGCRAWTLDIKPKGVRLFVVTCRADVERLPMTDARRPSIDFEALARAYDGLRIQTPNIGWSLFKLWDVESTIWFRWVFRNVRLDGVVNLAASVATG